MTTINEEAEKFHQALFSKEKKEEKIIEIILDNDLDRRAAISEYYQKVYNEAGISVDIKSQLKGDFKDLVTALFMPRVDYCCKQIKDALTGISSTDDIVFQILTNSPTWLIQAIIKRYPELNGKTLQELLKEKYSGDLQRNLIALLNTERSTNKNPDEKSCLEHANKLKQTPEKEWGAKEEIFTEIFAKSSPYELVKISRQYYDLTNTSILDVIEKMSGKMKLLFKELLYNVICPAEIFADKIKAATKGLGTNTNLLEWVVVSRNDVDIDQIRDYYQAIYKKELKADVKGDTSGAYRDLLLALIDRQP